MPLKHCTYISICSSRLHPSLIACLFRSVWTCLLAFVISFTANSQSESLPLSMGNRDGLPHIRNYPPKEYGAHNQNWAIAQDHRGIMYFGNNHGVLEYDGVQWRVIPATDKSIIRSLAAGRDSIMYIGSYGEFGMLMPDSTMSLHYVSLMPHVDTSQRDFTDVWQTLATNDGIYFVTPKYIFRWRDKSITSWTASTAFTVGFEVNGKFYVRQRDKGLMHIEGDALVMIPQGERFKEERFLVMLPFPARGANAMIVPTRNSGLLIYNGSSIEKLDSDADAFFRTSPAYTGTRLTNGWYALGTVGGGIVILDEQGKVQHHLTKSSGLQDETIWYLYADRESGLWAGMHLGISRIEITNPFTHLDEKSGIEGSVLQIARQGETLYAASSMGIYFRQLNSAKHFSRLPGPSTQGWAVMPFGNSVLAATYEGIYQIRNKTAAIIDSAYAMSFYRSKADSNRVFVGLHEGAKSIYQRDGIWIDEGTVGDFEDEILSIYESPDRAVWLTTRYVPLIRLMYTHGYTQQPVVTVFDTLHGLPEGNRTIAFHSAQGLRFGTTKGIYQFDPAGQRFYPDTALIRGFSNDADIFSITEDPDGNLWIVTGGVSGVARRNGNAYTWDDQVLRRIGDVDDYFAYADPLLDNITWIGCLDRIIRYDGNIRIDTSAKFRTMIRRIIANGDSILYDGAGTHADKAIVLKNGYKSLRLVFAAPTFDDESQTLYQYKLVGYDDQWSAWSQESYKDFTGLPAGEYSFIVRSKNIYNQQGDEASVQFQILPPFYLSSWAFLVYGFLITAMIVYFTRRKVNRLRAQHARELKEVEYVKLKELDQLKSRFFADISHEFRTPLTLILGPVDNLMQLHQGKEEQRQYHLIRRNAQRLLRLINQLLDLSKLDAGKMKLVMQPADIILLCKGIMHSFESLAEAKYVSLSLHSELEFAVIEYDRDKMEQVLSNLVANAIKFTETGGRVDMHIAKSKEADLLLIDVIDTGAGIAADQLPHVFDRFYQGDEAARTAEPGTGIGLALAKELVDLHKGRITVESIVNEGTRFTIHLPFKKEHQFLTEVPTAPLPSITQDEYAYDSIESIADRGKPEKEYTVLLVEDNPDMRAFIRETLLSFYAVVEAVDGEDGIRKALDIIPDIIISDVMMPKKDGMELCDALKSDERTSHIPIILLTARADIESRLAGLKRGADDYLAKPFNREELQLRAHNLLDNRKRLWLRFAEIIEVPPATDQDVQIEDVFLQKIRGMVEAHLQDADFEIDKLARLVGMSRSQLFRKVKALTGHSPSIYIRTIRLHHGKLLLESTDKNVTEVAYAVGFSAPAYFSDAFSEAYGFRPSQLKKVDS